MTEDTLRRARNLTEATYNALDRAIGIASIEGNPGSALHQALVPLRSAIGLLEGPVKPEISPAELWPLIIEYGQASYQDGRLGSPASRRDLLIRLSRLQAVLGARPVKDTKEEADHAA